MYRYCLASASHSIGEAFQAIRDNKADVMITGGAEASLRPGNRRFLCYESPLHRNDDPSGLVNPLTANGMVVMGEGRVLVLEEMEHALERGYHPCRMIGYGSSADAVIWCSPIRMEKEQLLLLEMLWLRPAWSPGY